jgi:hypothetical protein
MILPLEVETVEHPSAPLTGLVPSGIAVNYMGTTGVIGGPDRDRTDDLFHAMI